VEVWFGLATARLALQYGRNGKITDWVGLISKDCPRKMSRGLPEGCGVRYPDLSRLFLGVATRREPHYP
jgi:hypothetical protein